MNIVRCSRSTNVKIVDVEQGSEEWLQLRRGKISGTRLGDIYAARGGRKIGFYETIAERLNGDRDNENRMDRGLRLEEEAAKMFEKKTKLKVVSAGICVSDENPNIINSPDGLIKKGKVYPGAIEIKCLSPARHWQVVIENEIPKEFESQKLQYFIVNEDLKDLFFIFFDPDNMHVPMHIIKTTRIENEEKIEMFKQFQIEQLKLMEDIVAEYGF